MAVPPKYAAHKLSFGTPTTSASGVPATKHTLELFLDYTCPFSAKIYRALQSTVIPLIKSNPAYASSLEIIFRQQVQPWHPSSTLTHEAALAVLLTWPDKFWDYSTALFEVQTEYFDRNVVLETRNQTYKKLAKLGADKCGIDEAKLYEILAIPEQKPQDGEALNDGNAVTNDLKVLVKMNRLVGVHVSPTVIFDGVVQNDVSSSWLEKEWSAFLKKMIPT